ncbi:hypothetical protein T484DRAFT_1831824 [Baffinella frigidus]|nr:hypothetical protein T484DRAFT_1831824 [Cryptophyta sp. CCMP2293]
MGVTASLLACIARTIALRPPAPLAFPPALAAILTHVTPSHVATLSRDSCVEAAEGVAALHWDAGARAALDAASCPPPHPSHQPPRGSGSAGGAAAGAGQQGGGRRGGAGGGGWRMLVGRAMGALRGACVAPGGLERLSAAALCSLLVFAPAQVTHSLCLRLAISRCLGVFVAERLGEPRR